MSNYSMIRQRPVSQPTTVSDRFIMQQNENGQYAYKNSDYSCTDDTRVISQISASTTVPSLLE